MKDLRPGAKIAERYVLESVIARGGMGAVYKAIDERLGRTVAIKVLLDELAGDATSIARFEREATATARLSHPGIVQMFDFGKSDGVSFIVMEHVVGRTLATELEQRGRIAPLRACELIEQALAGLSAAHEAGIVHRDIKPGNIMIVPTGSGASAREVVKVLDFGIAQLKDSKPYARLTKLGAVLGTPTFMSPEQARGEPSDPRTDVYATGIVLWCCLTGQRPFQAPDVPKTLQRVLGEMPPRADRVDASIPTVIAEAVERAVEKRPNARWPTALAFASALAEARTAATTTTSAPPTTSPAPSVTSGEVTREEVVSPIARGNDPTFRPIASAGVPPTTRPGTGTWRKPIVIGAGVALLIGIGIGIVVAIAIVGYGLGRMPSTTPAGGPVLAPLPITSQPPPSTQGGFVVMEPSVVAPTDACAQLLRCCEEYGHRVEQGPQSCQAVVAEEGGDPERCARRTARFAERAQGLDECLPGQGMPSPQR
jgi:serine/threonine-protein kinase